MVAQIYDELCEPWLGERVPSWGPAKKSTSKGFIHSWTDTISKDIGTTRHYITCDGHYNGVQCIGRWNRRRRAYFSPGLYCIYGSWVTFDGKIITETKPAQSKISDAPKGRNLKRLRRLWGKHALRSETADAEPSQGNDQFSDFGLLKEEEIEKVYLMINKTIPKCVNAANDGNQRKFFGRGEGGWEGLTTSGIVVKRDTGARVLGNYKDCCHTEPGGHFRRGDLEAWATWCSWSTLSTRDGRWRPGYHLEVLLLYLATIVDYGANRELWRNRNLPWVLAAKWVWQHTPCDVHQLFVDGIVGDVKEMVRREVERLDNVLPISYQPDNSKNRETQYAAMRDRCGEAVTRHLCGQPLSSARGYISAWVQIVPNDIQDYERDVLGGETNNLVRGLTSDQQVVDAAYMILLTTERAVDDEDYDMVDLVLGTVSYYLQHWRYNASKQFERYQAISVRGRMFGNPPEVMELLQLVQQFYSASNDLADPYGMLYDRLSAKLETCYWGCTCDEKPSGHDNWELLAQSLDYQDEKQEERKLMALAALCIGASHGDINCECGMDLACYEGFVRFFHPDTGLIPRMHYRTNIKSANIIAE
ncbi:uncharacterized protein ATNIH1004_000175 [Aspergillus tanneri]|nr:uncharacterized protein ATNIH1004_000175 [Aspergillus tanneri]KAA8651294.1 hypothetical protein ATNIH1004_000175 [Aspergillus tanneri]